MSPSAYGSTCRIRVRKVNWHVSEVRSHVHDNDLMRSRRCRPENVSDGEEPSPKRAVVPRRLKQTVRCPHPERAGYITKLCIICKLVHIHSWLTVE